MWANFDDWVQSVGAPALQDLEFAHDGVLNLYLYPEVADYTDRRPLGPTWHRLDSSVRATDAPFELPEQLALLVGGNARAGVLDLDPQIGFGRSLMAGGH